MQSREVVMLVYGRGSAKHSKLKVCGKADFANLQSRPSFFGNLTWDTSRYTYLKVRVKPSHDEGMRFFVNIQTDGPGKPTFRSGYP